MKTIKAAALLLVAICTSTYGQMERYSYKRELSGIEGQWHRIILPDDIFSLLSPGFNDLRIYGITAAGDTVEAPYILRQTKEKIINEIVDFRMLNISHNNKGYYFTFEVPTKEPISRMQLDFRQQNFDWLVNVEGSHDLQEWFTIAEDQRILSISNEHTDYKFTTITFTDSRFRYFRIRIKSNIKPILNSASLALYQLAEADYRTYNIKQVSVRNNKKARQTVADLELKRAVPVSYLQFSVKDSIDFYRPILIQYLSDSFKTEKGWKYNYRTIYTGTLSSFETNEFRFNSITTQKLRVIIDDKDNQPLSLQDFVAKGYGHEIIARFTHPAAYFLVYGNERSRRPEYDITAFTDKIPGHLKTLTVGKEEVIRAMALSESRAFFENKLWLWGMMILIIIILGWSSFRMMRKV